MKVTWVFSGGSTKIGLHVGAAKAFSEKYGGVDSLYGCSAGSIIAAGIAMGMDLEELVYKTDFKSLFKRAWWSFSEISDGANMLNFFYKIFGKIKLKDIAGDLNILAHSLTSRTWLILNKHSMPDMDLAMALRISTSIPIFFKPVEYKMKKKNGDAYYDWLVDGGVSKNYPIDIPDGGTIVGHLIQSSNAYDWCSSNMLTLSLVMFDQLLQANAEESIRNSKGVTIRTEYNKPFYEFETTDKEKEEMIELGYRQAKKASK